MATGEGKVQRAFEQQRQGQVGICARQLAGIAPRPETLDGAVVGLLANGKRNAEGLIEMACGILADRYEFNEIVARNKGNATRPCPEGMMEELAEQCDVVITASGD